MTWLLGRRSSSGSPETSTAGELWQGYSNLLESLTTELVGARKETAELRTEAIVLRTETVVLREEQASLRAETVLLREQMAELKKELVQCNKNLRTRRLRAP